MVRVSLMPRDIAVRCDAKCSDVSLSVNITYEYADPVESSVQRQIADLVRRPDRRWSVSIGGLELTFGEGDRLSSLGLYANFTAARTAELPIVHQVEPVWIGLPDVDTDTDGRFGIEAVVHLSIDRERDAILIQLTDAGHEQRAYSLADGLIARVDSAGCLASLTIHGIQWTTSAPVAPMT